MGCGFGSVHQEARHQALALFHRPRCDHQIGVGFQCFEGELVVKQRLRIHDSEMRLAGRDQDQFRYPVFFELFEQSAFDEPCGIGAHRL